jgi:hypothetical protein
MELTLGPSDLAEKYMKNNGRNGRDQAIPTEEVTFGKLRPRAQVAVLIVGKGMFHALDGQTHNAVYPPEE